MSAAAIAQAAKVILAAARRAHERGDRVEYERLMDDADEQIGLMVEAMPPEPRR